MKPELWSISSSSCTYDVLLFNDYLILINPQGLIHDTPPELSGPCRLLSSYPEAHVILTSHSAACQYDATYKSLRILAGDSCSIITYASLPLLHCAKLSCELFHTQPWWLRVPVIALPVNAVSSLDNVCILFTSVVSCSIRIGNEYVSTADSYTVDALFTYKPQLSVKITSTAELWQVLHFIVKTLPSNPNASIHVDPPLLPLVTFIARTLPHSVSYAKTGEGSKHGVSVTNVGGSGPRHLLLNALSETPPSEGSCQKFVNLCMYEGLSLQLPKPTRTITYAGSALQTSAPFPADTVPEFADAQCHPRTIKRYNFKEVVPGRPDIAALHAYNEYARGEVVTFSSVVTPTEKPIIGTNINVERSDSDFHV